MTTRPVLVQANLLVMQEIFVMEFNINLVPVAIVTVQHGLATLKMEIKVVA